VNFYRLRFINTLFILLIGVAIGFLFKKIGRKTAAEDPSYKPVYSSGNYLKTTETPKTGARRVADSSEPAGEESNPMDDGEDYFLPVVGQAQEKDPGEASRTEQASTAAAENAARDEIPDFVKNPASYAQKNVSGRLQMIIAKRLPKGWRLNFVYADENRNLNYLYVDDPENVSGDSPDFKIGYFYYVKFLSGNGDLKNNNNLQRIYATGEKTQWASGVSAIE